MKLLIIFCLFIHIIFGSEHETSGHNNLNSYIQAFSLSQGRGRAWYPYLKLAINEFMNACNQYKKEKNYDKVKEIIELIENHKSSLEDQDRSKVDVFLSNQTKLD